MPVHSTQLCITDRDVMCSCFPISSNTGMHSFLQRKVSGLSMRLRLAVQALHALQQLYCVALARSAMSRPVMGLSSNVDPNPEQ